MRFIAVFLIAVQMWAVDASRFSPFDSPDFCSQIITPTCNTTFSYIDTINAQIRPLLTDLVHAPFFRYFKLNLDKQCKFWNAQHFCATRNCAVEVLPSEQFNFSEVPDALLPSKLGEIQRPEAHTDESNTCEDLDYCHIDDDHHCVFVDLIDNPERFTGYGGAQSFDVWLAIYSENCFPNTNPMLMLPGSEPEVCMEKNLFYRVISGLHASIAVHLSNEYLDPATEQFGPNLQVFMDRVGKFNERVLNIYFNYALMSQAIVKLSELVLLPEYIMQNDEQHNEPLSNDAVDAGTYASLVDSISEHLSAETLFEASLLFDPSKVDPELKNEFRSRFRNVSAIMDCVGCDRCRMWGKLQTIGYGTALKILFDSEDPATQHLLQFRQIELVALFNTFDRISKSVASINNFKAMYLEHLEEVAAGRAKRGDYKPAHGKGIEFPFVAFLPVVKKEAETKEEPWLSPSTVNELAGIQDALYFVWRSYVDFPKTVFHWVLYQFNGWWNVYVGKSVYVPTKQTRLDDEL